MELDWSEQSPHIRTLFHPWQPGDGYDEATIQAAEARLGIHLPATLRNFYLVWGRRRDMTETMYLLLPPENHLQLRDDFLEFWVDTHGGRLWGIQRGRLEEADPSVMIAINLDEGLEWTSSHARLSDFLDDMIYENALCGGALYTGYSVERVQTPHQIRWLEDHWRTARESPMISEGTLYAFKYPTIHIREGQAVSWRWSYWQAAADSQEALDEIARGLQITWREPDPEFGQLLC